MGNSREAKDGRPTPPPSCFQRLPCPRAHCPKPGLPVGRSVPCRDVGNSHSPLPKQTLVSPAPDKLHPRQDMFFEPALVFRPPVYLKKHRKPLRLPNSNHLPFNNKPGIGNNRHPESTSPLPQLDNHRLPGKPVADPLLSQPVPRGGATEAPCSHKKAGQDEVMGQLTKTQMLNLVRPEIPVSTKSKLSL